MWTDFAEIWWLVCNLTSQYWRRISLKSDVVCQSYGKVYRGTVFSWTRCRMAAIPFSVTRGNGVFPNDIGEDFLAWWQEWRSMVIWLLCFAMLFKVILSANISAVCIKSSFLCCLKIWQYVIHYIEHRRTWLDVMSGRAFLCKREFYSCEFS